MLPSSSVAVLILMGGENKRMHGLHKAFLTFPDGTTFISHLQKEFAQCHLYLSVDDASKFNGLFAPLIEDQYPKIGPMGGIYSAFNSCPETLLFVTACDMPYITSSFASYLYSHHNPSDDCTVLCNEKGFCYPLGALYSRTIMPYLEAMIKQGNYCMQPLIRACHYQALPISHTPFAEAILTNINTPLDYRQLLSTNSPSSMDSLIK